MDNVRRFNPKMWATGHVERCPVLLYEGYVANRPAEMCQKDSPFWLVINDTATNGKFLKSQKMGEKKIDTLIKSMVAGLPEAKRHRLTNHSNRKTTIKNLLKNKVERSDIAQLTGHRNLKSFDSYTSAPLKTQKEMSSITSKHCSSVESMSESSGSSSCTMQVAATSTNTISSLSGSHSASLFGLAMGILAQPTVSPKYKPWLDQTRPDIFPNRAKICMTTYNYNVMIAAHKAHLG